MRLNGFVSLSLFLSLSPLFCRTWATILVKHCGVVAFFHRHYSNIERKFSNSLSFFCAVSVFHPAYMICTKNLSSVASQTVGLEKLKPYKVSVLTHSRELILLQNYVRLWMHVIQEFYECKLHCDDRIKNSAISF